MPPHHWEAGHEEDDFHPRCGRREVTLTRLDCGNGTNDPRRLTDSYTESSKPFTLSELPAFPASAK